MSAIHIADLLGEEELVIAKEFLLKAEDVKCGKLIGSGAFGVVYQGEWNNNAATTNTKLHPLSSKISLLAIKKARRGEGKKVDAESWQEEAYLLR